MFWESIGLGRRIPKPESWSTQILNPIFSHIPPRTQYDIKPLVGECVNQMLANIAVENAAKLLHYSDLYELADLKASIFQFICANSVEVMKTDVWKEYALTKPDLMWQLFEQFAKTASFEP